MQAGQESIREARQMVMDDDEISLMDIYDFLRDGWLTLVGMTVAGLGVGVVVSLLLPVKYQASGLIDSGRVGFVSLDQGVASREIEPLAVLAEKMKAPGFYSDDTLSVCGLSDKLNPRQDLVKELGPNVARNSNFVSVSYKAESVDAAKQCIDSVLADVVSSQRQDIESVVKYTQTEIANTQKQLEQAQSALDQQRADRDQSLSSAREQLAIARQELKALDEAASSGDSGASAVTAVRVLNKQGEVQGLESALVALQSEFNSNVSQRSDQINRLTNRLAALQAAIEVPNTRDAQFATPVFASDTKVSPRRSLIAAISLIAGGFLGLMILIGRRALKHIREHEAERKAKSAL